MIKTWQEKHGSQLSYNPQDAEIYLRWAQAEISELRTQHAEDVALLRRCMTRISPEGENYELRRDIHIRLEKL